MTPYSAAAAGSRSSRPSSRSRGLARVLGQLELVEPLAQLAHLGLLGVALAELLLDRLQLLAEVELALALLHLGLHLGLDLRAELEDLQLAVEDHARPRAAAPRRPTSSSSCLLLLGLQPQRRGDEVAERARVVDVRRGELQLLGKVRDEADDPPEQRLDVARQRLDLARSRRPRRARASNAADEVGLLAHRSAEPDAREALDEDPQRPVGPGWFNEESVQSLLFDLYDNGRDVPRGTTTVDDLALGFAPIWTVFANEQRTTPALTSVFPFVRALKAARPADQPLIDQLTTSQRIAAINDDYGSGQTNFGLPTQRTLLEVSADFNSIYDAVAVGGTLPDVCSLDDYTSSLTDAENKLASRRFVRFTVVNPGVHVITARAQAPLNGAADPDLLLHSGAGQTIESSEAPASTCAVGSPANCVETFSPTLQAGDYVLEVYEWTNTNRTDNATHPPIGRTCFEVTVLRP